MAQPLEDDTLEKIHSYVKDMDINGTYVDMTEQLLMFRPENPIRFMIDYLSFKHKDQVSASLYYNDVTRRPVLCMLIWLGIAFWTLLMHIKRVCKVVSPHPSLCRSHANRF